jgi:hypothetical protein
MASRALAVVGVLARAPAGRWAELPALERVVRRSAKALFLLGLVDREPVLEEQDAVVDQHLLEHRRLLQEGLVSASVQ